MKEASKWAEKDETAKNVFFAMERANAKMNDMRSNTLMQLVNRNLFTVGNWKQQIKHHKGNEMTSR